MEPVVPVPERVQEELASQAKDLLQEQLSNLSTRLFEAGKKADQQLTVWIAFAALTPLILFGASEDTTVGGVKLNPVVAGAVTYLLSCAYYYRAVLTNKAAIYWRNLLKRQRRDRFFALYETLRESPAGGDKIEREFDAYRAEYPGYLACSVLVKDLALKKGTLSGKYVALVHRFVILVFGVSPYVLAACLLYASWLSWWYVVIAAVGLFITLSGNAVLRQHDDAV